MQNLIQQSRRPDISFRRDGTINITAGVAKNLNLSRGDFINIAIHNCEFLLYVSARACNSIGRHHARCIPSKKGSYNFRAYSALLCRLVLDNAGVSLNAAGFMAGSPILINDKIHIPIITLKPLI